MLFKIIFYNLKLISRLKHVIFDIILIFLCIKRSSCIVSASLKTAYFGLGLTVVTVAGNFFPPKILFSLNDMLFSNSYFNYIIRYFQGFDGPIVSRHFQRMKIWIDKKAINFANFTTSINISETRLPTSASLHQAGICQLVSHM